ncbi:MAG: metallopeptidase family protein [Desulfocucumaceae bacterium]
MAKGKGQAVSIDGFVAMAGRIVENIPHKFLKHLNGGFNISEECKKDGGYYIMGEYLIDDALGSVIMIYYGSFVQLMEERGSDVWESELRETIHHELRHHIEIMAGVDYLSEEEMADWD